MTKLNTLFILFFVVFLISCDSTVREFVEYDINEPVFMSANEFRSAVDVKPQPEPIRQHGKICFYNNYLFISEPGKGIHIIDNRNNKNPRNIAFIELIGNADIIVRNDILYADSFVDLVWFDISNPEKPILKGRKEEVFPHALPPIENNFGYETEKCNDRSKGIVVGWKTKKIKKIIESERESWWNIFGRGEDLDYALMDNANSSASVGTSINGSMARFTIYKDYLYTTNHHLLDIFDLSAETPVKAAEHISLGRMVETIFSYKDNLFFGTPTGMLIYSVENPVIPEFQSSFSHIYGCDPVVVEDDLAYVTIRSGNLCGQNANQLFIVDVTNTQKPKQIVSYTMTAPKGLGIDNKTLFVCDDGLKIFDAENPQTLMANQLAHFNTMDGFDVIPYNNTLMIIADDGIYQYDYSDLQNIRLLSKLPIGN